MKSSENINELIAALAKARRTIKAPVKSSENPYYKSRYADLAECLECSYEALSDNGLAIIQMPKMSEGKVVVETLLGHSSGQWISEELALMPVKQDPQACGSAITYARRYAVQAFLNIAPEDDDDGNKASAKTPPKKEPDQHPGEQTKLITEQQRKRLFAILKEAGETPEALKEYLSTHGIASTKDIPQKMYDAICEKIKKIAENKAKESEETNGSSEES